MKRFFKWFALLVVVAIISLSLLAYWYLRWDEISPPELPGTLQQGALQHQGINRTWTAYVPAASAAKPALLLLLHGSLGSADYMRASTFYSFDLQAERGGFIAVYPDGFQQHWNDCRAGANYSANLRDIDDVGFLSALVAELVQRYGADQSRIYVAGISNGGQMAYRMGLEAPERVAGIAAIAANLPLASNLDCTPRDEPVATLILNGTRDPVNPYEGGLVQIFGDSSRGQVRSAVDTARYWARLAGHAGAGLQQSWPDRDADDGTTVQSSSWTGPTGPPVQLLSITGGGHTMPHPVFNLPKIAGATSHEFDGAEVIWAFFSRGEPVQP